MEKIYFEPTRVTPLVNFDPGSGMLEMKGRSSPENSIQFYQPVLDALEAFTKQGPDTLIANFAFEYFNTSSSKCLFDLFKKLDKVKKAGKNLVVNWFYEEGDEDMMEAGEDYSDLLGMDFNFMEIED